MYGLYALVEFWHMTKSLNLPAISTYFGGSKTPYQVNRLVNPVSKPTTQSVFESRLKCTMYIPLLLCYGIFRSVTEYSMWLDRLDLLERALTNSGWLNCRWLWLMIFYGILLGYFEMLNLFLLSKCWICFCTSFL